RNVVAAGVLALPENPLPRGAAVLAAEEAALLVWTKGVAERRHIDEIGILRVNLDLADVAGVAEAEVSPGLAAVGRLVDAVAVGHLVPDRRFAGTGVDHVRIGN